MRNYRSSTGAAAAAACILLCVLAGCGQGAASGAPSASGLPLLPAPSLLPLRAALSTEGDVLRSGDAYEPALPHGQVAAMPPALVYTPAGSGRNSAYAVYGFNAANYDRDETLRLSWDVRGLPGTVWAGFANFTTNRWDWYAVPASDSVDFTGKLASYTGPAPGFGLYAAIVVTGSAPQTLASARLGAEPGGPVAVLEAQPLSGAPPLQVDFDAAGSSAAPPATLDKFEFDFGEGAGYEDFGAQPQAQHTYTAAGMYTARLRVTDSNGASAETQAVVMAGDYDEVEPNDIPSEANALALPLSGFAGSIGWGQDYPGYDGDQEDYFTFAAASGTTVDITLTCDSSTGCPELYLADGNDTWLEMSQRGTDSQTLHYTFGPGDTGGPYYIYVYQYDEGYTDYTLDIAVGNPTARLSVSAASGNAPLNVTLDASASSASAPATISTYQFDPEGSGVFTPPQPMAAYNANYASAGVYYPEVLVTDSNGQTHSTRAIVCVGTAYGEIEPNHDDPADATALPAFPFTNLRGSFNSGAGYPGYDGSTVDAFSFSASQGDVVHLELRCAAPDNANAIGLTLVSLATGNLRSCQVQDGYGRLDYEIGSAMGDPGSGTYYVLVSDRTYWDAFFGDYTITGWID